MKTYNGIATSPGQVVAPVRRLARGMPALSRYVNTPRQEQARLELALETARDELAQIEQSVQDQTNKDILQFQSCLLEDDGMINEIRANIAQGMGAAAAVELVGRKNAEMLYSMTDNEYMQLRTADIQDVCGRVVDILDGRSRRRRVFTRPVILAGEILLPSDLAAAPEGTILGVITGAGSPQSHAAIIARSMGIPGIAQVGSAFLEECDGRIAALDADSGTVMLDPTPEVHQQMVARICSAQRGDESLAALAQLPCRTRDGVEFSLRGSCFSPEDIHLVRSRGGSAVGTVRSEYLHLRGYIPGEEEQYRFYRDCLTAADGLPVTVRTFDLGADRTTGALATPELNPELGMRGIRYSLAHPDQFEDQLCALLRAGAEGPLSVTLPMVGGPEDWKHAMQCVEHAKLMLRRRGEAFNEDLAFGATLEVPSAVLEAEALPPLGCRFFTIGLNDLVQYTHAADRNSYQMALYYRTASPAIRRLIAMAQAAAADAGIPIWIDGIALGNPRVLTAALRLGLRSFAAPVQDLLSVKRTLLEASTIGALSDGSPETEEAGWL